MPSGFTFFDSRHFPFAVIFLRTHASGNGGQHVVFSNLRRRAEKIAGHNQLHELLYLYTHRAIVGAGRLGALQAAQRFLPREFGTVAEIHLAEIMVRAPRRAAPASIAAEP